MTDEPHSHEPNRDGATSDRRRRVRSVRFTVPGLTRPDDADHVRDRLQRVDGVTSTTVQSATRTVDVSYDPDLTAEETVRAAIADAGYAVDRDRDRQREQPSHHRARDRDGCNCRCCTRSRKRDVRGGSTGPSR